MLQTISLLVENKPGALMRITGVLSARGWNIDSLTVARTLDPEQSRMTIVVDIDPALRRQVMKQMNKLINVLQATDLTESLAVRREMALVRVRATPENRAGILRDAEIYVEKLRGLFEDAKINSLTVTIMQVPCCRGLLGLAMQALKASSRKVPVKSVIVSLQGEVLQEEWATA